jgi:hypothetical protein
MEINDILLANSKAKGKRPYFFNDAAVERVLNITMAVAGELAVMHERLDTIERLLEAKGTLSRADIEAYRPDAKSEEERQRWHAAYIARILRIVQQEMEAIRDENLENNRTMDEVADELEQI